MGAGLFALSALILTCAACDEGTVTPPIASACVQIGSQCQLPGGPLGVCQQMDCAAGAQPPCFKCVSQH